MIKIILILSLLVLSLIMAGLPKKNNVISFSLSRGSFATIILREIIKPENPLISGF